MKPSFVLLLVGLLTMAACHPGPVISTDPKLPVGGTIAGIVSRDTNTVIEGRKVTAINTESGMRHEATTGPNGGYTIKVPEGHYRLEVALQPGEWVAKQPADTRINKSDLDPRRDFVIAIK